MMWRLGLVILLTTVFAEYTWAQRGPPSPRTTSKPVVYKGPTKTQGHGQQPPKINSPSRGVATPLHRHKREYCPESYPPFHHHRPPPPYWGPPPRHYWPPPPPPPEYRQGYAYAQSQAQVQAPPPPPAQAPPQAPPQTPPQEPPPPPSQGPACDSCSPDKNAAISNAKSDYGDAIAVAIARAKKQS